MRNQHPAQPLFFLVGLAGIEPATSCSQSKRATKLRHSPLIFWTTHRELNSVFRHGKAACFRNTLGGWSG